MLELYLADQYGAREELLRCANLLLDEAAQRKLVDKLDAQLVSVIGTCPTLQNPPFEIFRISGALSLLTESLRDPDVKERATLRYSPTPNPVQRESFARSYIDANRPAGSSCKPRRLRNWAGSGRAYRFARRCSSARCQTATSTAGCGTCPTRITPTR